MDALLGLLHPGWRLIIGVCVALAVVAAGYRLMQRGPTRMGRATLVAGLAVVAIVMISYLTG